ncbi:MAG: hypothetical protein AVDCRST_MAG64-4508 [uncultured Phycisphaerae bacterium]|uniref:Uncharacterized protein n=1 Tax=uncultured Phycisphaerae bacterium TaxID=904963 RepID=A0A6J4QIS1_9BACT|nr:MAG: hypothetical protein AVDCRST_MAG64-4508 [uncultured Phycisphaerae bacterium]
MRHVLIASAVCLVASLLPGDAARAREGGESRTPAPRAASVDATTIHGKVMAGYQGWFRCPGDPSELGWVHWSRDAQRLTPETLTFEMWPDMSEYGAAERFAVPGFTHPDGSPAHLFSSDNAATVLRHFTWMRDYGIDGAWLQQFLVDLPGGTSPERYPSRRRVLDHVRQAAGQTGRAWALSYDIAGLPGDRVFDVLTADWKKLVDERVIADPRYLHEGGRPVVQVWGFYRGVPSIAMTPDLANRLIDFFHAPGPYRAFVMGGGDWDWRKNPDPAWQAVLRRLDAYAPWNVANYSTDADGAKRATVAHWADDRRAYEEGGGRLWVPVVYPGFAWSNLKREPPGGASAIPRRGGRFLWEQFHALAPLKPATVYVAMFDEVDEGTAIFKVTDAPPTQAHFVGHDGMPSDWYLRLVGEGARMFRGEVPVTGEIPIKP